MAQRKRNVKKIMLSQRQVHGKRILKRAIILRGKTRGKWTMVSQRRRNAVPDHLDAFQAHGIPLEILMTIMILLPRSSLFNLMLSCSQMYQIAYSCPKLWDDVTLSRAVPCSVVHSIVARGVRSLTINRCAIEADTLDVEFNPSDARLSRLTLNCATDPIRADVLASIIGSSRSLTHLTVSFLPFTTEIASAIARNEDLWELTMNSCPNTEVGDLHLDGDTYINMRISTPHHKY
uniref:F-box domain-containing protein n=1 Tax=Steinernema glaseri TaxID=37863 RepID=A0A1I7ZM93_9BILA